MTVTLDRIMMFEMQKEKQLGNRTLQDSDCSYNR